MLDKTKIYIIDFEDSFTYNIASELYVTEKKLVVISHTDFFSNENFTLFLDKISFPIAVILGPGPGNPEIYRNYFHKIIQLKKNALIYLMGICLGHQLIGLIEGKLVKPSLRPIHGEQVKIIFKNKVLLVQRYNSLAVFESEFSLIEIQIFNWVRGISYQFHPESLGTNNRSIFFEDLLHFLEG